MKHPTLVELYAGHTGKVTDKWSSYLVEYERLIAGYRDKPVRILEIGVQNGGSLEIWATYFANASAVIGCDINQDCENLSFDDARISVVVGDANDDATSQRVFQRCSQFDIIIDDGSHRSSDIVKSFARYLPRLADEGVFIVEDLHCSYWQEYEGGLFEPYSAMTFCKRLADIISHEHWGVPKTREGLLAGFNNKFGVSFEEATLARVHSVEFINSMCVVRLSDARSNQLGRRLIAGQHEPVLGGHSSVRNQLSFPPDQSANIWSSRALPPDEELQTLLTDAAMRDREIQNLISAAAERERQITGLDEAVTDLHDAIVARDQQITGLDEVVEDRDDRIADLERSVAALEKDIGAYHNAVREQDDKMKALNRAVAERDTAIRDIQNSTSWRVTRSFRFLSHVLRRARDALWGPGPYANRVQIDTSPADPSDVDPEHAKDTFLRQIAMPPTLLASSRVGTDKTIIVIIPIYRGLAETRRCIESAINSANNTPLELLLINDCSPEPEMQDLVDAYAAAHRNVRAMRNEKNLGFVKTVNAGMQLAGRSDVVLLNSDTEVANDWLDRLVHHAYKDERVGTVTPFSNNATICNYPDLDGWPRLPSGESVGTLDAACNSANAGLSVDIPTGVGFCMYIKRNCLDEVGLFDDDAFGKGYGEENDFCMRATSAGWRHVLATDVFVFHKGEISFGASAAAGKSDAMKVLVDRYPDYERLVDFHIRQNAAYPNRVRTTAARYRLSHQPVLLFVTHRLGGGTEEHVQKLACAMRSSSVRVLILRPHDNGIDAVLEASDSSDRLRLELGSRNLVLLAMALMQFGINKAHVHHTIGFGFAIEQLLVSMAIHYDVTIHDFYSICPRIQLITPTKGYCGSPTAEDCNACLGMEPKLDGAVEITLWRARSASLLNGANRVYCPSRDTAQRILAHFPAARVEVVPHELIEPPRPRTASNVRPRRRFALLGVLSEHKGLGLIEAALAAADKEDLPIEFVLVGHAVTEIMARERFSQTGAYAPSELPALIEQVDPDAIVIPARWPETYSYTLSAAIRSGLPIIVSDIGALPERVANVSNAFVFPFDYSGIDLARYLASIELHTDTVSMASLASNATNE